jgi:hypothetical protein
VIDVQAVSAWRGYVHLAGHPIVGHGSHFQDIAILVDTTLVMDVGSTKRDVIDAARAAH